MGRNLLTTHLALQFAFRRFLEKPWPEKVYSVRYRFKRIWGRLFPSLPLPCRLPYGGWWLAADDVAGDAVFTGNFEMGERRFLERFLKPGMTMLDIGAHHGFYTILAAKKVGPTGKVIAFEPSPRERRRLLFHLRLNRLMARVTASPLALGKETGKGKPVCRPGRRYRLQQPPSTESQRTDSDGTCVGDLHRHLPGRDEY